MKILYTTDQIYKHGGIEKVLSQKANWLAENGGHEVYILTHSQKGNAPVYPFSPKIQFQDLGINYEDGVSYFHPSSLKKAIFHREELRRYLRKLNPDVLISCSFGPDFYFLPYIEKFIPKIKEFHSSRFYDIKPRTAKEKLLSVLASRAETAYDALAVLNPDEKLYYHNKQVTVIPNPAESVPESAVLNKKRVIAAGRISPVKNFSALVSVWEMLHKEFSDWQLHFYGEDYLDTKSQLEQQIAEAGLAQVIRFMGVSKDMKKTLSEYSIYAMTSETECFPMVLLESLSVGLPAVTFDAPTGPKHIVTAGKDGFVVPHHNLSIFAEKLKLLMRDVELRKKMGAAAKENARRFEISAVMQQWQQLFDQLVNP